MCQRCKTKVVPPLREALKTVGVVSVPVAEQLLEQAQSMPVKTTDNNKKSRKIWDLKAQYHCPIIGTCLRVLELQKLARQADIKLDNKTDYEIHTDIPQPKINFLHINPDSVALNTGAMCFDAHSC